MDVALLEPLQVDYGWTPKLTSDLLEAFEILLQQATDDALGCASTAVSVGGGDKQAVSALDIETSLRVQLRSRAVQALASVLQSPKAVKVGAFDILACRRTLERSTGILFVRLQFSQKLLTEQGSSVMMLLLDIGLHPVQLPTFVALRRLKERCVFLRSRYG